MLLFYVRLARTVSRRRCPFSEEKPADTEGGSYRPAGDGPGGTGRAKALRCEYWGSSQDRQANGLRGGARRREPGAGHPTCRALEATGRTGARVSLHTCVRVAAHVPPREPQESQKTKEEAEPSLHAPYPLLPPPLPSPPALPPRPPRPRRLPLSNQFKSQPLSTPEERVPRAAEPWGTTSSATLPSWASRSASSLASTT